MCLHDIINELENRQPPNRKCTRSDAVLYDVDVKKPDVNLQLPVR